MLSASGAASLQDSLAVEFRLESCTDVVMMPLMLRIKLRPFVTTFPRTGHSCFSGLLCGFFFFVSDAGSTCVVPHVVRFDINSA